MAGGVAVSVGNGPAKGKGAFLVLAEVAHAKENGAVVVLVEEGESVWVVFGVAIWIGVDE